MSTLKEIADNYINGNLSDVKRVLAATEDDALGADAMTVAARALDIRNYLLNNYGAKYANGFSAWLVNHYSDLK